MNMRNLITIWSAAILIGAEVFGIAFAAGWAIAGMFELGRTVQFALMGVFSLIGLYAMVRFIRHASTIEPIRR